MSPFGASLVLACAIFTAQFAAATTPTSDCRSDLAGPSDQAVLEHLRDLKNQVEQRLAPHSDIFNLSASVQDGAEIYAKLMFRPSPAGRVPSLLGEISTYLHAHAPKSTSELQTWVPRVETEADAVLKNPATERADLFRANEALKILITAYAPLALKPDPESRIEPQQMASSLAYPEIPDAYVPRTRALDENPPQGRERILYEVNIPGVRYWRQKSFRFIRRGSQAPFAVAELPGASTRVLAARETQYVLKVDPLGAEKISLMIPFGYVPVQISWPNNARIERDANGTYTLFSNGKPLNISLMQELPVLNKAQMDFLTQPVGISFNELPGDLQDLLNKTPKPLDKLNALEKYLQEKPLFSVDALPETDPIAALERGAFQCNQAVYLMAAIARDILHLPTSIGAGFVGVGRPDDPNSYVYLPSEGHAWVQLFLNNRWYIFDPNPKKPTRERRYENKPPTGFYDNREQQPPEVERDVSPSSLEPLEDFTQPEDSLISRKTNAALADEKINQTPYSAPERARRLFLLEILNPQRSTAESLSRLESARQNDLFRRSPMISVARSAERVLRRPQPPIREALEEISRTSRTAPLEETFASLGQIESRLSLFISLLDASERTPFNQLLTTLREIKSQVAELGDQSSTLRPSVQKYLSELPPIAREILKERFDTTSDEGALAMSRELADGQLADFNLMRLLNPIVDFVMPSTPKPARRLVTVSGEQHRRSGSRFIQVRDMARARIGFRAQPKKSALENLREGTLWLPGQKPKREVSEPGPIRSSRRMSLALYDTTISLEEFADFLSALVATLADKSLSDVDPLTNEIRHKCLLLGFDKRVHTEYPIYTREAARDLIRDHRNKLVNTRGLTDIRQALIDAVGRIVGEDPDQRNPLSDAEIILLSDGGSPVDVEEFERILRPLQGKTRIRFMFISINGFNPALKKISENAIEAGASSSYYRSFDMYQISQYMIDARQMPIPNFEKEIYTTKGPNDLPSDFNLNVDRLTTAFTTRISQLERNQTFESEAKWRSEIIGHRNLPTSTNDVIAQVRRLSTLLASQTALQRRAIARVILEDFLKNFALNFQRELNALDLQEAAAISALIEQVKRYDSL